MRVNQGNTSERVPGDESAPVTPAPAYDMGRINASSGPPALALSREECKEEEKEGGGAGAPMMMAGAGGSGRAGTWAEAVAAAEETQLEAFARRQPIRELTPHLVEELEGEGGGFTLTVFRNNKQVRLLGGKDVLSRV